MESIRLDIFLYAARFFKTRSLAKNAINSGKVYCNGQKTKVSKKIVINDKLKFKQGFYNKEIIILALNDKRTSFQEASKLYKETENSILEREKEQNLQSQSSIFTKIDRHLNKKQKREIINFKRNI